MPVCASCRLTEEIASGPDDENVSSTGDRTVAPSVIAQPVHAHGVPLFGASAGAGIRPVSGLVRPASLLTPNETDPSVTIALVGCTARAVAGPKIMTATHVTNMSRRGPWI